MKSRYSQHMAYSAAVYCSPDIFVQTAFLSEYHTCQQFTAVGSQSRTKVEYNPLSVVIHSLSECMTVAFFGRNTRSIAYGKKDTVRPVIALAVKKIIL